MYKIALTGKANYGKNTAGHLLSEKMRQKLGINVASDYGKIWKCDILAFADPIKEMARQMFPDLPSRYFYGSSKDRAQIIPGAFKNNIPLTIRQLLIDLGTGVGRDYKENVWIDALDYKIKKADKKSHHMVIITDVRFRNEFDYLKQQQFYQIKLLRNEQLKIDHFSETEQDTIKDNEFDYILYNNGTLDDLNNEITKIVQLL